MSLPFLIVFGLALLVSFFALIFVLSRPSKESVLLAEVAQSVLPPSIVPSREGWATLEVLAKPLGYLRGLLGREVDPQVARRLARAGYRRAYHADILIGAKLILPAIAGLAVAAFVNQGVVFFFMVALAVGFFAPEFWLARAIRRLCEEIRLSLPDALDLLAICLEAGLGLDQAIVKVGSEIETNLQVARR